MSKVLVDRELLERAMYANDGKELIAANRELRAILAQPAEAEGVEVVAYATPNEDGDWQLLFFDEKEAMLYVDEEPPAPLVLQSAHLAALSAVTAERDRLRDEIEALRGQLAESQANDRTAMGYLSDVRQIVGGDDFPSMVANVARMAEIRCEGCGYMTHHREHMGCVRAAMAAKEASDEPS
ncbi:MAG: hypothetical protein E2594_16910 [Pseudomonas sp.]|nr:hypothetical protein [Pseudomonas sp.]